MIKYGLFDLTSHLFGMFIADTKEEVEDHYKDDTNARPGKYKVVAIYIDEEPPTPVVKDDLNDRQFMFLSDDGGDPKLFDHMAAAKERIAKEGNLYQHIGRMECVFKPIEEM